MSKDPNPSNQGNIFQWKEASLPSHLHSGIFFFLLNQDSKIIWLEHIRQGHGAAGCASPYWACFFCWACVSLLGVFLPAGHASPAGCASPCWACFSVTWDLTVLTNDTFVPRPVLTAGSSMSAMVGTHVPASAECGFLCSSLDLTSWLLL